MNEKNITSAYEEQEIDFKILIEILIKHKYLILISTFALFMAAALYILIAKPVYEAKGKLLYESQSTTSDIFGLSALSEMGSSKKIETQLEILKSSPIMDSAISKLGISEKEASDIQRNLSISNIKGTDVFTVTYQNTDPIKATQVVNTFMDAAIENNIEVKKDKTHDSKTFVEEQLAKKEAELAKSEETIRRYKEKEYIVDVSEESKSLITRYAELDGEKMKAKLALQDAITKSTKLRKELGLPASPNNIKDTELEKLKNKLEQLQATQLSQTNSNKNIEAEIEKIKKQITDRKLYISQQAVSDIPSQKNVYSRNEKDTFYQNTLKELISIEVEKETLIERLKKLDMLIADYNHKLQKVPTQELELTRLLRDREVNAKIYEILLTKGQEINISTAAIVGDLRVIEPSGKPQKPIKPKKIMLLSIGLIMGLLIGLVLSFGYEYMRDIPGHEEVSKLLNKPIIWNVPKAKNEDPLISFSNPRDTVSEAFRTIRTHFKFISPEKTLQSMVITSSVSGDGKSFVASNLAIVMAQLGKKVLLMDGDIRKPSIHKIFNIPINKGLSAYLIGEIATLDEILHKSKIENLYLVPSGPIPPNASELLDSTRMGLLLDECKKQFDFIVIDTPPIIAVSDSTILYGKSDGMIFVVAADETTRSAIKLAQNNIEKAHIKIIGAVLNKINLEHNKYITYYEYGNKEHK